MALPTTRTITLTTEHGDVTVEKVNQDNKGVTYFKKLDDGSELSLTVERAENGKKGSGLAVTRHMINLYHTTWDDNNNPIETRAYVHMLVRKDQSLDMISAITDGLRAFLATTSTDVLAGQT